MQGTGDKHWERAGDDGKGEEPFPFFFPFLPWIILFFCRYIAENILLDIFSYSVWYFVFDCFGVSVARVWCLDPYRTVINIEHLATAGFFCLNGLVNNDKNLRFSLFSLLNTKLYSFQICSLWFILKIFPKFRKFQRRYSHKINSCYKRV